MAKMTNGYFHPSVDELDEYLFYVACEDNRITRAMLRNIKELFDKMINLEEYDNDFDSTSRIYFIKKYLKAVIDENMTTKSVIVDYVAGNGNYHEDVINFFNWVDEEKEEHPYSDDEINDMDMKINNCLRYSFMYRELPELKDNIDVFLSGIYNDFDDISDKINSNVAKLNYSFNKVRSSLRESMTDFDSNDLTFMESIKKTHYKLTSPDMKIKTSVKMLNKMLNGGLEKERLYIFAAAPGVWKSGQLLNICMDAKHYNKFTLKDPNKKPAILLITQENSINETNERIWTYYFGNDSMSNYTVEEVQEKFRQVGFTSGTNLFIKYRQSKSICCQDIEGYIDEYSANGFEVVLLVHDYTKRLRPNNGSKYGDSENMFAELGAITDELNAISKSQQIPVVSAAQLNRKAYETLDSVSRNKLDKLKNLNNSFISESTRLVENVDYLIFLDKELNPATGEIMLAYKATKKRGNDENGVSYFVHPFENGMKLKPDIDLPMSLSLNQLSDGIDNKVDGNPTISRRRLVASPTTNKTE